MTDAAQQPRACFVGDSFTAGVGDPTGLGWVGRVTAAIRQRGTDFTPYNLGIRRNTSRDIAHRWRDECTARLVDDQPRLIVFCSGVNDSITEGQAQRVTPQESLDLCAQTWQQAKDLASVVVFGPPPVIDFSHDGLPERIKALSEAQQTLCQSLGLPFLPLYDSLLHHGPWISELRAGDGAHPAAGGYQTWAALALTWPAFTAACGHPPA
jgi:lysophospholipase L1-like esterase